MIALSFAVRYNDTGHINLLYPRMYIARIQGKGGKAMKKKVTGIILAAAAALSLTACGGFSAQDASAYVKSALDAEYKAEFDEYVKQTDSTQEEAEAMYQEGLDTITESFGLDSLGISDELVEQYRDVSADLLALAKYEVKGAEEDGEGYAVEVSYEPYTGMINIEQDVNAAMEEIAASITEVPSEEELNELVYGKVLEILQQKIAEPEYGEAQKFTIHVTKGSDNVYSISQDDLVGLDYAMFQSE